MENLTFSMQNNLFKENKLRRVIKSKISDVSDENILKIIQSIDINKQYYIKATRNPTKFLNVVTEEKVICDNDGFQSKSQIIYGSCKPGKFINKYGEKNMIDGCLESVLPAAAIKSVVNFKEGHSSVVEYVLVIYEPMKQQAV